LRSTTSKELLRDPLLHFPLQERPTKELTKRNSRSGELTPKSSETMKPMNQLSPKTTRRRRRRRLYLLIKYSTSSKHLEPKTTAHSEAEEEEEDLEEDSEDLEEETEEETENTEEETENIEVETENTEEETENTEEEIEEAEETEEHQEDEDLEEDPPQADPLPNSTRALSQLSPQRRRSEKLSL